MTIANKSFLKLYTFHLLFIFDTFVCRSPAVLYAALSHALQGYMTFQIRQTEGTPILPNLDHESGQRQKHPISVFIQFSCEFITGKSSRIDEGPVCRIIKPPLSCRLGDSELHLRRRGLTGGKYERIAAGTSRLESLRKNSADHIAIHCLEGSL
jgi:hypothetical protein